MAHKCILARENKHLMILLQVISGVLLLRVLLSFCNSLCFISRGINWVTPGWVFTKYFFIKGHRGHVCLIQESLLIFISVEADNGQALLELRLNYPAKMRFQIVHHYRGLRSHYLHGDVLHRCILMVHPHNRESQEAPNCYLRSRRVNCIAFPFQRKSHYWIRFHRQAGPVT